MVPWVSRGSVSSMTLGRPLFDAVTKTKHRLSVYDAMIGSAMHACGMRPRSFVNRAVYHTLRL